MKRILVPTDFSNHANHALHVAAQLAKHYNAELFLHHILELPMHLIDPMMNTSTKESLPETLVFMKAAHERFEKFKNQDFLKGITVNESIGDNDLSVHQGIINACKDNLTDMIIMGSHGSSGLEEFLVGSNTEKVVRNSDVPVLVIKKEHLTFEVNNFIYATNFDTEDKPNIAKAYEFAQDIGANLHLLWVNTPGGFKTTRDTEQKIQQRISNLELGNTITTIYNDVSVEKGILNYAKSINAGLIGIGTHGRKGISHFINGSLSEDIVNHANIPVLTLKI